MVQIKNQGIFENFLADFMEQNTDVIAWFRLSCFHKIQESNCVSAEKKDMAVVMHVVIRCLLTLGGNKIAMQLCSKLYSKI
jgi:hypothetical protein